MSRSWKKTYGFCDRDPFMKKYANKKIRNQKIGLDEDWIEPICSGGSYRKNFCSYNICDYRFIYFESEPMQLMDIKKDNDLLLMYRYQLKEVKEKDYLRELKRRKRK